MIPRILEKIISKLWHIVPLNGKKVYTSGKAQGAWGKAHGAESKRQGRRLQQPTTLAD